MKHTFSVLIVVCVMLGSASVLAQDYPAKPVRVIVPIAAGGNLDNVTRAVAQRMAESLKQPVIVENRVGAGGALGAQAVARSAADGYTLITSSNTLLIVPAVVKSAGYDPIKEFTCVSIFAQVPQILVVHPSVAANSVGELIALAKREPGKLTYASGANGGVTHITTETFAIQAGIQMTHIPYKGNAPALTDVVGGQVNVMFDTLSTSIQYIKAGRLKALGVTSKSPSPIFPSVPTIAGSLQGYEADIYNVMLAPVGTPASIISRLHAEVTRAIQNPELRNNFLAQGVELVGSSSPAECNNFLKAEYEKYQRIVRVANIKGE